MPKQTRSCRVLITGSNGRLGRQLQAAWRLEPPVRIEPIWQTRRDTRGSLTWSIVGSPYPQDAPRPDVILNLAGVVGGTGDLRADAEIALAVCAMARAVGCRHVFLVSSAAIYGPTGDSPAEETTPPDPRSDYGRAKRDMEQASLSWHAAAGPNGPGLTILRVANVAGADAILGDAPARKRTLDTFADQPDGPLRSYIGPLTFARVLSAFLQRAADGAPLPPLLNIAQPRPLYMADLLRAARIVHVTRPAPETAIAKVVLATGRLERLLPFRLEPASAEAVVRETRLIGPRP